MYNYEAKHQMMEQQEISSIWFDNNPLRCQIIEKMYSF